MAGTQPATIVASSDFIRADGSPAYGGFAFDPLAARGGVTFRFLERAAIAPADLEGVDVLVNSGSAIPATALPRDGRLRFIAQFGAGFDHIDLAACTRAGVGVANTPAGVRRPVATAILALVLAVTGKLMTKERLARQGPAGWAQVTQHDGVGLTGKTVGTVGLGNIARDMVRLMTPLDVRFLAHDPYANAAAAATLGVEMVDLPALFRRSDIVCVNTPLTPETRKLVSAPLIGLMKPTAYLINTARGGVVDQAALTAALRERRIAGAGLDVFETEPLPADDPLLALDNVVLTPHALCWTDELYAGCGRECLGYVDDVLAGRVPAALLNRDVLRHPRWAQGA